MKLLSLATLNPKNWLPSIRGTRVALRAEPMNLSATATASTVQSAIRQAESGDTRQLFALYRDLVIGHSHVQSEFSKRKLAVLGQPDAILPEDKNNKDDVEAAEACKQMIADCENWLDGLTHLLDSSLWPVSTAQKIFRPVEPGMVRSGPALRFTLKKLEIINPTLLCFRQQRTVGTSSTSSQTSSANNGNAVERVPTDQQWEPDLRFWHTEPDGTILWDETRAYPADPMQHIVHRGHLLVGVRDNYGGPMRAVLAWWLLAVLGRDWFGRFMERYGSPFPVARTDTTNKEAVEFLTEAMSLATKLGGMVVDQDTAIELKEAVMSGAADAHEKFLNVCNREISKIIVGQTLSGEAQPTGLGSGTSKLQGDVREDFRVFDQIKLGLTLRQQLFEPFLRINGLRGRAPKIVWGGLSQEEAASVADLLVSLSTAGFEPVDEALPTLTERIGFGIQRKIVIASTPPNGDEPFAKLFRAFSAGLPRVTHPSDAIAARKAKALGDVYRGSMAPFRQIVLTSTSKEDALEKLTAFYADWKPERLNRELEDALQICAAAGASEAAK